MSGNVTRWTGSVQQHDRGGFVAYGDYLKAEEERDRLRREITAYDTRMDNDARRIAELERDKQNLIQHAEPDWSGSETLLSEMWKSPLHPMPERLIMADGAVAFRNKVIANLRRHLALAESQLADEVSNRVTQANAELAAVADGADQQSDEFIERVARAIAEDGFGRPWDDFHDISAHDTDKSDLTDYARAAVSALLATAPAEGEKS